MQGGTRLCSQSQRAALRATILIAPRKTVSFIQTTRCAMQTLQLIAMQHVELTSATCLLARSCSQLDEAAKALHTMRVFVAAVAFMSRLERLLPGHQHPNDQGRRLISRCMSAPAARDSQRLLSLLLLLLIRRRRVASALRDVQLSNKRDVTCASAARAKTK